MNTLADNQPATQIAFIFNNVANYGELAAAFRSDVEVHILDASQDGLAQMASILAGRSGIEALHVIGHGAQGSLDMGSLTLDSANIGSHSQVLGQIGGALAPGGDILLYGCDVGADAAGAQFVGQIAQATGAVVAASTDATGGTQFGGNWTLEYHTGAVTAEQVFDPAAVRNLDTLLATTVEDVTYTMNKQGVGSFVPGFALTTTETVQGDPSNGVNGGIYLDSSATSASFTVSGDGIGAASFDLAGMTFLKPFGPQPEYTITITGHKAGGGTATAVLKSFTGTTTFTVINDFTNMTGLVSFDAAIAVTNGVQGAAVWDLTLDAFTVNNLIPLVPGAPLLTSASDTGTSNTDNLTNATSLAFSGIGPIGDSTSTVQVFIDKNNNGTYDAGIDISGTATLSNGGWTVSALSASGLADGTYKVYSQLSSSGGGKSSLSTPLSVTIDRTAPTLAITSDKATLKVGETATITFTFSEDPGSTFTKGDVFLTGGALSAISGSGTTRTAIFTPTANTNAGSATFTVGTGAYTDAAGNAGGSAIKTISYDTKAPTVAITSDKAALIAGQTATITFTFSEDPGATFSWDGSSGGVVVTGGTLSAISGTGATRTAVFTPAANTNSGTASITIGAGTYTDAAGNAGVAGATPSISYDTKAPTVTITSDQSALHVGQTANITFTFSEDPGSSFSWDGSIGGVAVSGGTLSAISGSGTTRTAVFTPAAGVNGGAGTITIAAGAYTDAAGNPGVAGATPSISYDTKAPTVTVSAGSLAGGTATITFTFDEDPGASFSWNGSSGDVLVTGGTLGAISGTGTTRTAVFTAAVGASTANIAVVASSYTDAFGNPGAGASTTISLDTTPPDPPTQVVLRADSNTGLQPTDNYTKFPSPTVTGIAEAGSTVKLYEGGTLVGTASADASTGNWAITTSTLADGAHILVAKATDAAGNVSLASAPLTINVDTAAPTVSITSSAAALTIGQTATVTFTFSEDPGSTFTSGDIAVSGGTLSALSGSGTVRTAVFTPTAGVNGGTASITIAGGSYTDVAGNAGVAGSTPSIQFDTLAPTVTISSDKSALKSGETAAITFTFSEDPGSSFTSGGITVSGGTLGAISGTGTTRTAVFTPTANTNGGTASITIADGAYSDVAGNAGHAGTTPSLVFDTMAPTLAISSDKAALIAGQTAAVTFTFSEDPGSSFTSSDIVVTGGTLSALSGSGTVRTAVFTPTSNVNAGTASITVAGGAYTDAAGNAGGAGTTPSIQFDTLVPTVAISSDKAALKIGEMATITFTFSEDPGSTFASGDIAVSGGTLGAISGTGATRTAVFTPTANTDGGTASITIAEGSYLDAAGNAGHAGTTPSLVFDTKAPTLAITSDKSALIAGQTATVTFTFSEDPGSSFTSGDIAVSGGTLSALSGSGAVRTAVFTPTAGINAGTASITVAGGAYTDTAGNAGGAGTTPGIQFDTLVPTVAISSDKAALKIGETATITFTFSEDPGSSFASSGITVSGGTLGAISGTGAIRTAVFTPTANTNGGTASITIAEGSYLDAAGNAGHAGTTPALAFDTKAPTLAITSDKSALIAGQTATVTFTFSEDPGSTFTSGDIVVSGGTLSALSGTGTQRTAVFTPAVEVNAGTASITVAGGAYADAAGNAGVAGTAPTITFDTLAPTVTISSDKAALKAGETAIITFSFSEDPGANFSWDGSSGSVTISGGTLSAVSGAGATRTAIFTPTANTNGGVASITIADGAYFDAAGNAGHGSGSPSLVFDTKTPTLAITSDKAALNVGQTATVTFTFSEDPGSTFTSGDVVVSGGTLSALFGSGAVRTAVFTPAADTNAGTASITVAGGSYTDAAGNAGGAGSTPGIHFDTLAPTVTISSDKAALKIGETATITFTFSEDPGTSFGWDGTVGSLRVSGGTLGAVTGAGTTRTAVFTPTANTNGGTASIAIANGAYSDAAGNAGHAGTTPSLVFDTKAPTLAISSDKAALIAGQTATVTFTFSEDPGSSFTGSDIVVTGGTLSAISGNGAVRAAVFTPTSNVNAGTASITVAGGAYTDAAGNAGGAGTTPSIQFDTLVPTVAISSDKAALKIGETATITFTFSEDPGNTFASGDIAVSGGTLGAISGTGTTRTAVFTPTANTNGGTASITIAEGSYLDAAGNAGHAGTTPALVFDTLAPNAPSTPALALGSDTGISSSDNVTKAVTPILTGTTEAGATVKLYDGATQVGSGTADGAGNWSIATSTLAEGSHTISAKATDAAGNTGAASAALNVVVDTTGPALVITSDKAALIAGQTATVTFTFSEDPGSSFTSSDIVVTGGTLSAISGSGTVRTAVFTPTSNVNAGTASIMVPGGAYTDTAGNAGGAGTTPSIQFDTLVPTVAISSDKAALKIGETATITFTFSEDPGSSFASGGITVSGGTLGAISGTGTTRTAVFTPTANTNGGTASITIAEGSYLDAAGNAGHAGITPALVFDTLAPNAPSTPALALGSDTGISSSDNVTKAVTPILTGTAEAGATVKLYDGATQVGTGTADGAGNWSIATSTLAEGSHTISAKATDAAGNTGAASAALNVVVDTTGPALVITSDKAALIAGQTATVTFTFSEDPGSSFTSSDIVVTGGTLSAISGSGTVRTAVFTPSADVNAGTASITVASGAYTDAAGNDGGAGTTPGIQFDTLVPTVAISSDKAALKIGETATITFTFSEDPGSTFTSGDITVSGGTLSAIAGTGATRTAVFTPTAATNGGSASITIDAGKYADAAGNAGHAGTTPGLVFDTLAPNAPSAPLLAPASDSGASSSDNITNAQTLKFTGTAEDGATITLIDNTSKAVLATGTATGGLWSIDVNGLPEGVASVAAFATDAAGNAGATSNALAVTIDRTAPGAPSLALANGAQSGIPVNDGTVKVLNLAGGATWQYSLDHGAHWLAGTGDKFQVTTDNSYAVIVRQADTAGNISAASAELRFDLDTSGPTSTVGISDTSLTSGKTAIVTITFSEAVNGFNLGAIHAPNATLSNLASNDGGRTWTATLTPNGGTVAGSNAVSVDNTGVSDQAGNTGIGSSSSPNYSVQTSSIGAGIALSDTSLTAGEKAVVTIRFSEPVHGFSVSDLSVSNGSLSGLSSADGGLTWTATLTPNANVSAASNVISLDNARVTGASGQHGQGFSTSDNYSVFTQRPTASVSVADHNLAPGASTAVTIKFSEAVSGFDAADVSVSQAALSNLRTSDGGVTWTATLTAGVGAKSAQPGSISIDLGGVHDAAGNAGLDRASAQFVVLSVNARSASVDGTTVVTDTFTDPNGHQNQMVSIPQVQSGRVDDSSSSHPGLADIPLASNPAPGSTTPTLLASLPTGAGLLAVGPAAPLAASDAQKDLVQRINDNTASGSSTQADMMAHGQDFIASLGAGTTVQTSTIVPTVAPGATLDQPIVIAGATPGQGGPNAPKVGVVIDATGLPSGSTLQLDNVDFAAVTGNVRLFGGLGQNYVVGDAGSQTIYLGPDDDELFGGGGDDFIGSAGGNDILHGGDGNDLVVGGIGNDTLFGDAGDDTLNGGRSTNGDWSFHIAANGAISATHSRAVFTLSGSETVTASELDATVPELRFLAADPQKVAGIALLYAGLDRVPDLAGLSFWATSGASLQDVAKGVLASAEFGGSALGQAGNVAFITGMYQHVLGRAPEQAALDYWSARLTAGASRADVLVAVALSDEHKAGATTADGISIGQGSVQREAGWFTGSGDDVLDGGPGNDWLVGGDGFDTVVYSGNRAQYHFTIGADNMIHVLDSANGDLDTLSGIEAARFKDGTIDITVLQRDPAQLARVGLMYEAVLHRPADLAALASWTAQSMNAAQLAQAFTASADYQSKFAGMNDAAFVQALYANSGLAASAVGGMQSWQDYLGHHSRAELIASWIGQDAVVQAQFGTSGLWLA